MNSCVNIDTELALKWHPDKWYSEGGPFEGMTQEDVSEEDRERVSKHDFFLTKNSGRDSSGQLSIRKFVAEVLFFRSIDRLLVLPMTLHYLNNEFLQCFESCFKFRCY